jgi:flagellar P-ring protein precursor FlgI
MRILSLRSLLVSLTLVSQTVVAQVQAPPAQTQAAPAPQVMANAAPLNIAPRAPERMDRIKDLATFAGVRSNQLVGYGIVVGLNKTGDGNVAATLQSLQSMVQRFGQTITDINSLNAANSAAVMVTADLPAFAKPGQRIDVTVSALGKATSLKGGVLLMTQLVGADNETYAMAQGNLSVGGLGVEAKDGSKVSVNIPTVGRVPGGASVERIVANPFETMPAMMINLNTADFSTATRMTQAINKVMGDGTATAMDATTVRVLAPRDTDQRVAFMSAIEDIRVSQAPPPARVIVNSRTGTIVIGEGVHVTPAAVSHGSLTVNIKEMQKVTQPNGAIIAQGGVVAPGGQPVTTQDSQITVDQQPAHTFLFAPGAELSSIVDAMNAVGASPADLVAILEALKQAGSLHAELIVI